MSLTTEIHWIERELIQVVDDRTMGKRVIKVVQQYSVYRRWYDRLDKKFIEAYRIASFKTYREAEAYILFLTLAEEKKSFDGNRSISLETYPPVVTRRREEQNYYASLPN